MLIEAEEEDKDVVG